MASTLNIQNTINWAGAFISYQPLMIGGMEPAVGIANLILQTILNPPFCWRWNRGTVSLPACTPGIQDYTSVVTDFNFIEKAWIKAAGAGTDIKELSIKNALSATTEAGRPTFIAAQGDDNAGNITFRLANNPDAAYVPSVLYQKKPILLTSIGQTWSPIPDELIYIPNWGFLAIAAIIADDDRFPIFNNKFLSHLLGVQDGLDEMAKNIFLADWEGVTRMMQRGSLKTTQANTGRTQA